MLDQADNLRQLVSNATPCADAAIPPTIVVTGGRAGVGTTTVALNLAVALRHSGRRTALLSDQINAAPAGTFMLQGGWAAGSCHDFSAGVSERLIDQSAALHPDADVQVIDSGSGAASWTEQLWQQAGLVLVVTTPDDDAILDTYATIKRVMTADSATDLRVIVNQSDDARIAADAERRIISACQRFLGRRIERAPRLPRHAANVADGGKSVPRAWDAPESRFGRSVYQLGRLLADLLSQQHQFRREWVARQPRSQEFSSC